MKNVITYVGIDAHKKDLFIAMLVGDQKTPVTWTVPNEPNAVRRLVRKLEREAPGPVRAFYEAGPCGYALQRQLTTPRVSCDVVAPALIPRKPGERVKTNLRDSRKLVELGRGGLLTAVHPPTPAEEAVRDLARARDDAREDLQRCRHRLGKLLLRRGLHYQGRNWTRGHRQWLNSLTWTHAAERAVVDDYLLAIDHTEARLIELDAQLATIAETEPYKERVGWLRCFRGIDTLTAILILAELHDFRRFPSPRALMAFLGLVPGEDSAARTSPRPHPNPTPGQPTPAHAPTQRPTEPGDRDCGQGATAPVSALPTLGGTPQARAENRGRDRARVGRLPLGGAPAGARRGEVTEPIAMDERETNTRP